MLNNIDAIPTIAVKDVKKAKKFYSDTVGLKEVPSDEDQVLMYRSGNTTIMVYESEYAGSNKATAVTWAVGDEIDRLAKELKDKGVPFERYDFPGTTMEGDVHVMDGMKAAWFRDPDGNILAMVSG